MEFFVGIDWGTQTHRIAVMDRNGRVVEQFNAEHSGEGLVVLVNKARPTVSSTTAIVSGVDLTLGTLAFKDINAVEINLACVEKRLGHSLPMILGGERSPNAWSISISFTAASHFATPTPSRRHRTPRPLPPDRNRRVARVKRPGRGPAGLVAVRNRQRWGVGSLPALLGCAGLPGRAAHIDHLSGGYTGTNVSRLTTFQSLNVGGATLVGVLTTLDDTRSSLARSGRMDGNHGLPVYSRFRLLVVEPHGRLWFAPPMDAMRPFEVNHSGLTLQNSPSGAKIAYVAPGSPGEAAGLKRDDMIVTVDGAPEQRSRE